MGNYVSCISPAANSCDINSLYPASESICKIKFFNCQTGALSELEGRLTAAEAMMEFSSQFLCCFSSAAASGSCGRRICAVLADEELQAAELYLLLPMHRLNGRFSVEEITAFATLEAAQKFIGKQPVNPKTRTIISQSKVAPFPSPSSDAILSLKAIEGRSCSFIDLDLDGACNRPNEGPLRGTAKFSRHDVAKPWMPKLETVNEYAAAA